MLITACDIGNDDSEEDSDPTTTPELADQLVYYSWEEDLPQSVMDAFTEETGIEVVYLTYVSQEEAIENIRNGETYDLVVMGNERVPILSRENLLAELDYRNIPNSRNISPSFRNLSYDPESKFSIPYSWGTTGILVRIDLVEEEVTSWDVLWDPTYTGFVGIWDDPRTTIGIALMSLGYSPNSENPAELEEALGKLQELRATSVFLEQFDDYTSAPPLIDGTVHMAIGYAYDVLESRDSAQIQYVLPEEGTILWGDNWVIPSNAAHKREAELFLDFLLRPEISAILSEETYYAVVNTEAYPLIDESIINDTVIYPPAEDMVNAQILLPLSDDGKALHDDIWARFMSSIQEEDVEESQE
ncbi:MAG: spermidine/putrescine ABC transporter substrate-binding protein [Chloroflexi bacterium]|nr:spermidine/putrescine ABC transporter substrate-binding protein [Chloroflexota bacterium]